LKLTRDHGAVEEKDIVDFMEGQADQNYICFKEYLDFLPEIAERFPEFNFVIRPHPSENSSAWESISRNHTNVHVVYEDAVTPWIIGALGVIHFKSTTSIEAALLGKPVLTYMPLLPEYMKKFRLELPLSVSKVAASRSEFLSLLEEIQLGNASPGSIKDNKEFNKWVSISPEKSSAERIISLLNRLVVSTSRKLGPVEKRIHIQARDWAERFLCYLNQFDRLAHFFPRKLKRNPARISYGKHKIRGLQLENTQRTVDCICSNYGEPASDYHLSQIAEEIFTLERTKN